MRELTLLEIQKEELNILQAFSQFCIKKQIGYSLVGGTLLGAVRHKGFIPWDDDLDVSLSRIDYKKFLDLKNEFEKETGLQIQGHIIDDVKWAPFIKIINRDIQVNCPNEIYPHHLWIDVFPIDGLPNNSAIQALLIKCSEVMRKFLSIYVIRYNSSESRLKNLFRLILKVFKFVPGLKFFICVVITKISLLFEYGKTDKVAAVSWGIYGISEVLSYSEYESKIYVEFENRQFRSEERRVGKECRSRWSPYH